MHRLNYLILSMANASLNSNQIGGGAKRPLVYITL